jgi:ubiquinone/menaquinone biosynthesis C-methylase UbiE
MISVRALALVLAAASAVQAFQTGVPALFLNSRFISSSTVQLAAAAAATGTASPKEELLSLLGARPSSSSSSSTAGNLDPILCDPITKEPLSISFKGPLLGGQGNEERRSLDVRSPSNQFTGATNTYINLLEPMNKDDDIDANAATSSSFPATLARQLGPFLPPPLRTALAMAGVDDTYVPMRDLFTSPTVSYAYERGWRQGFSQAGFPGADREFEMAKEYFAPACATGTGTSTVVDMSCATGLFTRRFASEDVYDRVLGCDYSDSMLTEARRRIAAEPKVFGNLQTTKLELVRLDVGQLPFCSDSINALHAGAAMHCWPDLDAGLSEIYRVLKPNGGRYFATTFLSSYFSTLQNMDGAAGVDTTTSKMAFQYFASVPEMKELLMRNGFEEDKISIEVLGNACVVIRCEK